MGEKNGGDINGGHFKKQLVSYTNCCYFCLKSIPTEYMLNLHYITDASGNQIAVQIPMSDWLLFQKEYLEIKRKLEVLAGIKEAIIEVYQARKKNQKLQTLTEFLDEC